MGYKCTKTGIFCRTESVAMTPKIMGTYAHYVTLGGHCKMANSHRVTNLEKIPVRISKDEALMPLSIVGSLFISSLLFHLSQALLLGVVFSQFIHVCFIICKNEKVLFVLVQQTSDFVASLG